MTEIDMNDVKVALDAALEPVTKELTAIKTALVGYDGQRGLIQEHKEICTQVRKNTTNIKLMLLAVAGAGVLGSGLDELIRALAG